MLWRKTCARLAHRLMFVIILGLPCHAAENAPVSAEPTAAPVVSSAPWPPPEFLGRWTGEGRLGFREGKTESVKCRVTYFADGDHAATLKQNVRCATPGAAVEIKSEITESAGALSGVWTETVHNLSGDITGVRTAQGFRVHVKNTDLDANMDLILTDTAQVIEIQFHNSMLLGLSIVLTKG
jgi:hypothetical protein